MRKGLRRLLYAAPLALLSAGFAQAQTTGTIIGAVTDVSNGRPVRGVEVVASSPGLQGEQRALTDAQGAYRLTLLPPGEYTLAIAAEGYVPVERPGVTLRADKTIRANVALAPDSVVLEEQVVRTGSEPAVNIGTAESGAVLPREWLEALPLPRTVEGVVALVPGAAVDRYGVGFSGAQSPENAWLLDGLNVTDPVFGTFGARPTAQHPQPLLLTRFVQEIDVKTGGFMPEHGRATGGIVSVVTRSGSNELQGRIFGHLDPRFTVQPAGPVAGSAGQAVAWRSLPGEGAFEGDAGFELGGPIQRDRLWFYGGLVRVVTHDKTERFLRVNRLAGAVPQGEQARCAGDDPLGLGRCVDADGRFLQERSPGSGSIYDSGRITHQLLGKLTWRLDETGTVSLLAAAAPSRTTELTMNGAETLRLIDRDDDAVDVVARYAGRFRDNRLVVETLAGYHLARSKDEPSDLQRSTPTFNFQQNMDLRLFESVPGCTSLAECPVFAYELGGPGNLFDMRMDRLAARATAAYLYEGLGAHDTKLGLDVERATYRLRKEYAGNAYYVALPASPSAPLRLVRGHGQVVGGVGGFVSRADQYQAIDLLERTAESTSTAVFLQDSWRLPVANVTLNYGVRWEGQAMSNRENPAGGGFSIRDSWAPRVQAIWDFTGEGRGKVAGSWGRFYYAMPLDIGVRAFGDESLVRYRIAGPAGDGCGNFNAAFTGTRPLGARVFDAAAVLPGQNGCELLVRGAGVSGSPIPWVVEQYGGPTPVSPDLQGAFVDQFGGQVEYEVLADLSMGVEYTGRRQGRVIEDMSVDDGRSYFIDNPDGTTGDAVTFDPATARLVNVRFPRAERAYDGITVFARRSFARGWTAGASYTWSALRGNFAGPFRTEDGQIDPGVTSEYDLASLMANRSGWLPGDRRHAVKLHGAYTFRLGPRLEVTAGGAYTGVSGAPVSALGGHPAYGGGQGFILRRGMAGRGPALHALDLRGAVEYALRGPYALRFSLEIFNVLNTQEIRVVDENYTFDTVQPIAGTCSTRAAGASNPIATLQRDCPDLAYLKTVDGRPATVNPNWGRAYPGAGSFQLPISLRFGVALSF